MRTAKRPVQQQQRPTQRRWPGPDIDIRLIPDNITIPDYPTFTHMTFADHPPLVRIDAMKTSTFLEHPHTLDHTRIITATLAEQALSAEATRTRLLDLATTFASATPRADAHSLPRISKT